TAQTHLFRRLESNEVGATRARANKVDGFERSEGLQQTRPHFANLAQRKPRRHGARRVDPSTSKRDNTGRFIVLGRHRLPELPCLHRWTLRTTPPSPSRPYHRQFRYISGPLNTPISACGEYVHLIRQTHSEAQIGDWLKEARPGACNPTKK